MSKSMMIGHEYVIRFGARDLPQIKEMFEKVTMTRRDGDLKLGAVSRNLPMSEIAHAGNALEPGGAGFEIRQDCTTPRSLLNERIAFLRLITTRILFCIDHIGLELIQKEFQTNPMQVLTIEQFVAFMMEITYSSGATFYTEMMIDRIEVAQALADLFDTMDLNGTNTIEFPDFIEVIIHYGLSSGGGIDARQVVTDPISLFSFGPSTRITARASKKTMMYIESFDRVLIYETATRTIRLMDPDYIRVVRTLPVPARAVLALEYIHVDAEGLMHKLLAMAQPKEIALWEGLTSGRFAIHLKIPIRIHVTCLKWMTPASLLFGGGINGSLFAWTLTGKLVHSLLGHRSRITAMQIVAGTQYILTGSADQSVRLWDMNRNIPIKLVYNGHQCAITALAVNNQGSQFVSASMDGVMIVWNMIDAHPLLTVSDGSHHPRSITFATFIPAGHEFISGDESGAMVVWDTRLLYAHVQSLAAREAVLMSGAVLCGKRDARLLLPTDCEVISWDQKTADHSRRRKREIGENIADALIFAAYVNRSCAFITATTTIVCIWNALNGCLKDRYEHLMEANEISAICVDSSERKLIIGDTSGRIHIFNIMSGGLLKKLEAHQSEIIGLAYVGDYSLVVSLSRDGNLKTHNEKAMKCPVHMNVAVHGFGLEAVRALACSSLQSMVAVGDESGRVVVWDVQIGCVVDRLPGDDIPISSMVYLEPYPFLAVANNSTRVSIWALRPATRHGQCILTVDLRDRDVICLAYDGAQKRLYTGDALGAIYCFDMRPMIETANIAAVKLMKETISRQSMMRRLTRLRSSSVVLGRGLYCAVQSKQFGAPCVTNFQGASSSIAQLSFIAKPPSLYLLSHGPHLDIKQLEGAHLGTLGSLNHCRLSIQRKEWHFQVRCDERLQLANTIAMQVLEDIDRVQQQSLPSTAPQQHPDDHQRLRAYRRSIMQGIRPPPMPSNEESSMETSTSFARDFTPTGDADTETIAVKSGDDTKEAERRRRLCDEFDGTMSDDEDELVLRPLPDESRDAMTMLPKDEIVDRNFTLQKKARCSESVSSDVSRHGSHIDGVFVTQARARRSTRKPSLMPVNGKAVSAQATLHALLKKGTLSSQASLRSLSAMSTSSTMLRSSESIASLHDAIRWSVESTPGMDLYTTLTFDDRLELRHLRRSNTSMDAGFRKSRLPSLNGFPASRLSLHSDGNDSDIGDESIRGEVDFMADMASELRSVSRNMVKGRLKTRLKDNAVRVGRRANMVAKFRPRKSISVFERSRSGSLKGTQS